MICILLAVILLLGQLPFLSAATDEPPTPLTDFSYSLDTEARTVTLNKYIGSGGSVIIDGSYTLEGVVYTTFLNTTTVFLGNSTITSVTVRGGVGVTNHTAAFLFGQCTGLTFADLSGLNTTGATSLRCMFAYCSALETVNLTGLDTACVTDMTGLFTDCRKLSTVAGYETWNTGAVSSIYMAFNQTRALKKVDLSKWDLGNVTNSGWCFQYCGAAQLLLPDSLKTISAGFLNHAAKYEGTSFAVPTGVAQVGYAHTFYDFGTNSFAEFTVPEGNTRYKAVDGILYSADGRKLLAVPRGKTFADGVYEIPEGVTFLGELCFSRNGNIKTLILPDSLDIHYVGLGDPNYIIFADDGNLNAGSNLNIAIYCYTGITAYGVKGTNPNYASREGILYTKDMSAVVAIPARYDRHIQIPEGVTAWGKDALWAVEDEAVTALAANCTGVSIPASLVNISEDQIRKLNSLNRAFDSFSISVSRENPVYCVDENGDLTLRPTPPETTPEETIPTTTPTETVPPETVPSTVPAETIPSVTIPSTTPPIEVPPETVPEETTPPPSGITDIMPPETLPVEVLPPEVFPGPSAPEDTQPATSQPAVTEPPTDTGSRSYGSFLSIPITAVFVSAVIRAVTRKRSKKL